MPIVMIDAGHGGNDPGAVFNGRKESDDVLAFSIHLAAILRTCGVSVHETRISDKTLSLRERSGLELRGRYNYFISIHRNALKPERANGAETFIYRKTTNPKSKALANKIQEAMVEVGFKDRKVKAEDFHVLRETRSPAVLLEIGFIDHSGDNRLFDSEKVRLVHLIADAILTQLRNDGELPQDVPVVREGFYTVKRGDTLYGIAEANKTTVAAIVKKNNLENQNLILVGQKIKMP